jgi:transposase
MEVRYQRCCGIDVHARMLVACLIVNGKKTTRTFSTITKELLDLLEWLTQNDCTHVAIESTGVYWKPVFNILEGHLEVILVNPQHVKALSGRKTDRKDAERLADLLRHGQLTPSFIPPASIRDLRELTRHRTTLVADRTAVANRIVKLTESGNIKLKSVLSDPLGVSGRRILRALARGETDLKTLALMADALVRSDHSAIERAVDGRLTQDQRWILGTLLDQYEQLSEQIDSVERRIRQHVESDPDPFVAEAVELLDTIPGVGQQTAQIIIAEIGVDMSRFPTHAHLASWAGLSPGNNESAGKRKSGKTRKGNRMLRAALVNAALGAIRKADCFLAHRYRRIAGRLGHKKAVVAIAHDILIIAYHIVDERQAYRDLKVDELDRRSLEQQRAHHIRRLEALGLKVSVEPTGIAA